MSTSVEEFDDLLAVYAIGAVEPDERGAIEAHLATDADARAEVDAFAAAAATLDQGAPRPEVLEAILAAAQPRERRATVVPLVATPRPTRNRAWRVLAVAAAVALGVVAFRSAGDTHDFDADLASAVATAQRAAVRDGESVLQLRADGSDIEVTVAVVSDTQVLLSTDPDAADGSPLRVWAVTPDGVVEVARVADLGRLELVRIPRGTVQLVLAATAGRAAAAVDEFDDAAASAADAPAVPTTPTSVPGTPSVPNLDAPPGPVIALPPLTLPSLPPSLPALPTVTLPSLSLPTLPPLLPGG